MFLDEIGQVSVTLFLSCVFVFQFNIPADGMEHPYTSYEVPVVRFYYNAASEVDVYQKAHMLTKYYGGSLGVLLINW